ncbi:MAG: hypothetical protein CVU65_13355 [Deltaproteobacteria bacterium HGW-Deltaproteobacteria-22]|jgi:hypothetical protein|nr:MAG: hypothetical protein CVU65_13355 [Deltaproteobacteria bacterium HGW-Deltaproteobacteria-22]
MKNLIALFTIFGLLFFLGCDDDHGADDTPTMSTCILYADDPVACEQAGCTVMGGYRSVVRDGRCVANMPFACFPYEGGDCENMVLAFCSVSPDDHDSVASANACSMNLGSEWVLCTAGEGWGNEDCYPDPVLCEAQTTLEACHAEYCTWIQDARRAIMNEGTCTGWEETTVSICASYVPSYTIIRLYRETQDGTEMFLSGVVTPPPDVEQNKEGSIPDPWSFCTGFASTDDPICASCPEPTK